MVGGVGVGASVVTVSTVGAMVAGVSGGAVVGEGLVAVVGGEGPKASEGGR